MTACPDNLPATTKSRTPTFGQSLPAKLHDLVMGADNPIVGPKTAGELRAFAAEPEPPTASKDQVDVMIGKLAMATAQPKISKEEAKARLDLYWLALNDIPVDDLRWAFTELLRGSKFLPTPAEIRSKALKPGSLRKYAKSRARHLVWKHEMEWRPAVELLAPEEAKALLATVKIGVDVNDPT